MNNWRDKMVDVWNYAAAGLLIIIAILVLADALFRAFGFDPSPIAQLFQRIF
jgi:hypothetical protein